MHHELGSLEKSWYKKELGENDQNEIYNEDDIRRNGDVVVLKGFSLEGRECEKYGK